MPEQQQQEKEEEKKNEINPAVLAAAAAAAAATFSNICSSICKSCRIDGERESVERPSITARPYIVTINKTEIYIHNMIANL